MTRGPTGPITLEDLEQQALNQYATELAKELFIMHIRDGNTERASAIMAFREADAFMNEYTNRKS